MHGYAGMLKAYFMFVHDGERWGDKCQVVRFFGNMLAWQWI